MKPLPRFILATLTVVSLGVQPTLAELWINNPNPAKTDPLRNLIDQKQAQYSQYNRDEPLAHTHDALSVTQVNNITAFNYWLTSNSMRQKQVMRYQKFLQTQLTEVPPMEQLLVSARSADECGYEPYELPPEYLWANIVPTLRMIQNLKQQGYLPRTTVIRSVYRNPDLNRCAGGAEASKHMTNGAVDVWIPEYEGQLWEIRQTVDKLCEFWQSQGQGYQFGLGLYATGAIHLDTQGWRKWGASSSHCL